MADEPITPAATEAVPAEATILATPQTDPTPTQTDSKKVTSALDAEIDALWAEAEGKSPKKLMGEDASEPVAEDPPAPKPEKAEAPQPKQDAPKAEAKPADQSPPAVDPAEIERQVRARIDAEQATVRQTEERIRNEQQYRQQYEAYVGPDTEYQTVVSALEDAQAGDYAALDGLDVMLPDGRKTSQVKGTKGLTQEEAVGIKRAWDTARKYENVMGDRKVQRLVDLWNSDIMRTLSDPDVDVSVVTKHTQPHQQMEALRDSVRERVTKRLTDQHTEAVRAKDAEIERLNQRVTSLVNERGNVTSQQRASTAASVERPGQPGTVRQSVPTPEELAEMPFEEAFKSGAIERVLRSLPGGLQAPRRRTG